MQDFWEICCHLCSLEVFLEHGCFDIADDGDDMHAQKSSRKKLRDRHHTGSDNHNHNLNMMNADDLKKIQIIVLKIMI